jgi:uncharacterized protein GlcG (DUF336 family)
MSSHWRFSRAFFPSPSEDSIAPGGDYEQWISSLETTGPCEPSPDLCVIIFGGGIPLQRGGIIVGAIGVSGGTVDQDVEVASAGVEAFAAGEGL